MSATYSSLSTFCTFLLFLLLILIYSNIHTCTKAVCILKTMASSSEAFHNRSIYIQHLPLNCTSEALLKFLNTKLGVVDIENVYLSDTEDNAAFVLFSSLDSAVAASEKVHKRIFEDSKLKASRVTIARGLELGRLIQGHEHKPDTSVTPTKDTKQSPASSEKIGIRSIIDMLKALPLEDKQAVARALLPTSSADITSKQTEPQKPITTQTTSPSISSPIVTQPSSQPLFPLMHSPMASLVQSTPQTATTVRSVEFPRIVTFSGKGDVTYEMWRYEVRGLLRDNVFPEAIIMQGVRKSLRGAAAEVLLHMGEAVTVTGLIDKMDMVFGKVLPPEAVLEKFYTARQKRNERVAEWACRIEGLLEELKPRQPMTRDTIDTMLRTKFFSGLCQEQIKVAIRHKYDAGESYNGLLMAARMLEGNQDISPQIHQEVVVEKNMIAKLEEITRELQQLSRKVEQIEQRNVHSRQNSTRKTDFKSTFSGKCYACGQVGHKQAKCALNEKRPVTKRDVNSAGQ